MDSFYDVKGNEVSKESIVAEFVNNYTGSLTDFNEGSEIRNLLEAFAVYAMGLEERINDSVYIMDIMNADGEYLDLIASQPQIDMERIDGVEATGYVLFTIQTALNEELLIPAGTVVTSDTGVDFETVTDNFILPGETSMECMVQAIEVGIEGNIPENSILTKIDGYDAVDGFTVSNPNPFTGGVDYEEDDSFRDRIVAHMSLQKFGSKPYYIAALMNEFTDAHDIFLDTSSQSYTAVVTPNTYDGDTKQAELEQEVMAYLSDENNVLISHTFDVASPTVQQYKYTFISGSGTLPSGFNFFIGISTGYTEERVTKAVEIVDKYIKGGDVEGLGGPVEFPGLNLNQEISVSELISAVELTGMKVNIIFEGSSPYHYMDSISLNGKNKYKLVFDDV